VTPASVAVGCVITLGMFAACLAAARYSEWRRWRRTPEYRRCQAWRRFHRAIRGYPDAVRYRLISLYLNDEDAIFGRR
jgi:hypothetical protein